MAAIYLDYASTAPRRGEVLEAIARIEAERFGNPSSVHRWGQEARAVLEESRERLAAVLGAQRDEVIFTGSGTEADNLAVLGRWRAVRDAAGSGSTRAEAELERSGRHPAAVVCSAVEHKAVLGAAKAAAREGAALVVLAVDEDGCVPLGVVDEALAADPKPAVVSVMWGNNEVGAVQPVAEIGARCRAAGVSFHTDAVQAFGRVPVRVADAACDLLTLSAHKIGGPRGIGALYVREGVELETLQHGGEQEHGLRPGTQDVAAAAGFALAAELAASELQAEAQRLGSLRDRLDEGLREGIPGLRVNGEGAARLPHILNVSVPGVEQEEIVLALDLEGVAVSSGSACQSGSVEPSHVLAAMGQTGGASVRLSLGRATTEAEVDEARERVTRVVERLRSLTAEPSSQLR